MIKRLSLLLGAITVLAAAAPAAASASALTMPAGTLVPVFTAVTLTSTNAVTDSTTIGPITCGTVILPGAVTKNSSGTFMIEGKGEGKWSTCVWNGKAIQTTDVTLLNIVSSTSGSGKASLIYTADLPGLTCTYTASSTPFTYVSGSSTITFGSSSTLTVNPAACGPATLTGDFELETTSGGSVVID